MMGRIWAAGKLQAVQTWQETSQAHLQGKPTMPGDSITLASNPQPPLPVPHNASFPHLLAIDIGPAAADHTVACPAEDLRPSRAVHSTSARSTAAAQAELAHRSPGTPQSAMKAVAAHEPGETVAQRNAIGQMIEPGSWAQHASRMSQRSSLHTGNTRAASWQGSPASGQSTQDLIEGIESRYQQARAILRNYQR